MPAILITTARELADRLGMAPRTIQRWVTEAAWPFGPPPWRLRTWPRIQRWMIQAEHAKAGGDPMEDGEIPLAWFKPVTADHASADAGIWSIADRFGWLAGTLTGVDVQALLEEFNVAAVCAMHDEACARGEATVRKYAAPAYYADLWADAQEPGGWLKDYAALSVATWVSERLGGRLEWRMHYLRACGEVVGGSDASEVAEQ